MSVDIPPLLRHLSLGWQTKGTWVEQLRACVFVDSEKGRDNIMATFFSEAFLLLVMTTGLLRQRDHYLGRLLFNQVATSIHVSCLSYN